VEYRNLWGFKVSVIGLGTWALGNDRWWGPQKDEDSFLVLEKSIERGINLIDTAPIYGRGHSEELVGKFLEKKGLREKIILSTKLGLNWHKNKIFIDLRKERMREEIELSRKRLRTDYIDIYFVHWPSEDMNTKEVAEQMYEFYKKKWIKLIGVSNFSVAQMKEFLKYAPLHVLQPPYNFFKRDIEKDIIDFCLENKISIISYAALDSGVLTGKFFKENSKIPDDLCRRYHSELKGERFKINKYIIEKLEKIASRYKKTLTQFILNWTYNRKGITSILVGMRNLKQVEENILCTDFSIKEEDLKELEKIFSERLQLLKNIKEA